MYPLPVGVLECLVRRFIIGNPGFEAGGDAALEKLKSHAPKQPRRTPDSICEQIILMRQHHPDWGKRRIAAEQKNQTVGWHW